MSDHDLIELRRRRNAALNVARKRRAAIAHLNGVPISNVPAQPIRDHINALRDLGWSWKAIADMHGASTYAGVRLIAEGDSATAHRRMQTILEIPLTYRVPASIPAEARVPAGGAIRRVQGLLALGWTHDHIAAEADGYVAHRLAAGVLGPMTAVNWRRIDHAFKALSATPGPSARNRGRAKALGYVPPLAWDDIDDPAEQPKGIGRESTASTSADEAVVARILAGEWRLKANIAERIEVIRRAPGAGITDAELERRTGWSVSRYKRRNAEEAA